MRQAHYGDGTWNYSCDTGRAGTRLDLCLTLASLSSAPAQRCAGRGVEFDVANIAAAGRRTGESTGDPDEIVATTPARDRGGLDQVVPGRSSTSRVYASLVAGTAAEHHALDGRARRPSRGLTKIGRLLTAATEDRRPGIFTPKLTSRV